MERLTVVSTNGEVYKIRSGISDKDAWMKLAAYENTGLTLEEINKMKARMMY